MKLKSVGMLLLLASLGFAQQPAAPGKPLDKGTLQELLAGGVESDRVAKMVEERGIAFEPTDDFLQTLRAAGAKNILLEALRAAGKPKSAASAERAELVLQISATERVWVSIDADGKPALERVLNPSEVETVKGRIFFDITADNAHAVKLVFENETLGNLGRPGEIKTVHLTRDALQAMRVEAKSKQAREKPAAAAQPQANPTSEPAKSTGAESKGTHAPSDSPGQVYNVGGDVSAPVPIYKPSPAYSAQARLYGVQGSVTLRIVVDTEGNIADARVVKGLGWGLDEEAARTVRKWKFKPGMRNGVPVPVAVLVRLDFQPYR